MQNAEITEPLLATQKHSFAFRTRLREGLLANVQRDNVFVHRHQYGGCIYAP